MAEAVNRHFLLPGEIAYSGEPAVLSTLLGSCVAVCLHDPRNGTGGMNHYMLPGPGESGARLTRGKYGNYAVPRLIEMAAQAGSRLTDLTAQVYGGGNVTGHLGSTGETGLYNIGDRNVLLAETMLHQLGVKITRRDTGGHHARKIHLDTSTGKVQLGHIAKTAQNIEREQKLAEFRTRKIGVLVVDDSKLVRSILKSAIENTEDLYVCGEAANPFEAREEILAVDPDVVSLDIIMPRMDGLTFLKKLMQYKYIPTVVVSTTAKKGSPMVSKVLQAGAVAAVDKDALSIYQGFENLEREYLPKLRQAATTVKT